MTGTKLTGNGCVSVSEGVKASSIREVVDGVGGRELADCASVCVSLSPPLVLFLILFVFLLVSLT